MAAHGRAGLISTGDSAFIYPCNEVAKFFLHLQSSTLAIVPAISLLTLLLSYFSRFRSLPQVIAPGPLLWMKLTTAGALACVETVAAVSWASTPSTQSNELTAALLSCLAAICLVAIINIEHRYTLASTAVLALWFAMTLVFDSIRIRAYLAHPERHEISVLAILASTFKAGIAVLNEFPKKSSIQNIVIRERATSGATAGFWSRALIIWLGQSVAFGFRDSPSIQLDDDLDSEAALYLSQAISAKSSSGGQTSSYWLLFTVCRTCPWHFIKLLIPRFFFMVFSLSQATFAKRLLVFMSHPNDSISTKLGLVCAVAFIHFGITASRAVFKQLGGKITVLLRGSLTSSAYTKLMALPASDLQRQSILKVVDVDIEVFLNGLITFSEILFDFIELAVCVSWLLQLAGHVAVLFLALIATAYALMIFNLGNYLPAARQVWQESSKLYVAKASSVLSHVKAIRMAGLDTVVSDILERLRSQEMLDFVKFRRWSNVQVTTATFFHTVPGPVIIVRLFVTSSSGKLAATDVYPTLVLLALLYNASMSVVKVYSTIKTTSSCMSHVQEFLLLTEQPELGLENNQVNINKDAAERAVQDGERLQLPSDCVMKLDNASLAPSTSTSNPILKNMNLLIKSHELVMVAGPTGCGKSIFLRALTGQGSLVGGRFSKLPGRSGYCDQTPWLQHASIRDNIVGHGAFMMSWYNNVIQAVLLNEDFEQLPDGDSSIVGTGGSNLSSGQVYRIALARALYARAPYLILDNIFSVLDRDTSLELFGRLFGANGLLKQARSTVIMTTHSVSMLRDADRVFFIDGNGFVTMHTDSQSIEFQERLASLGLTEEDEDPEELIDTTALPRFSSPVGKAVDRQLCLSDLASFYFSFFKFWTACLWALCLLIAVTSLTIPVALLRYWLDSTPEDSTFLEYYGILAAVSCIFIAIAFDLWYSTIIPATTMEFHGALLSIFMRAKISFLTQSCHRSLLDFFHRDLQLICDTLPIYVLRNSWSLVHYICCFVIMATAAWHNLVTLPLYAGLLGVALSCYVREFLKTRHADMSCRYAMSNDSAEQSAGLRHIKAFGWQTQALQKSNDLLLDSQRQLQRMLAIHQWLYLIIDGATSLAMIGIVLLATFANPGTPVAGVGVSIVVIMLCSDSAGGFIEHCAGLGTCLGALEKLQNLMANAPQERQGLPADTNVAKEWPHQGRVVFREVTARYNSNSTASDALKTASVSITPGHKVAIVGRTGSGKSSFLMGLLNFLDYIGTIKIDGTDIRTMSPRVLREHITTISHDVIDLGGSVRFNLCPWTMNVSETKGNVHFAAIQLVLNALGLWDVIEFKGGLDKPLASLELSHGQLQLLSIARGMLRNLSTGSNLVIMDETTCNLDQTAANLVQKALNDVFPDHTVISVVREEDTPVDVDLTIRMANGRIVSKVENANGPAARKAAAKKLAAEREAAIAAATARSKPPPPTIHPFYQHMMTLQTNPYAPPFERPHRESEMRLRREFLRRQAGGAAQPGDI